MRYLFRFFILFLLINCWASNSVALEEIVVRGERIDNPDLSHLHDMTRMMEQQAHFDLQESMRPESFVLDVDVDDGELESCSDPVNGPTNLIMMIHLSFWDVYGPGPGGGLGSQAAYRDIAEAAQKQFGGQVSYADPKGLYIKVIVRVPFGAGEDLSLSIMGDPSKSLYENILDQYDFEPEEDELEEFACKAPTSV